MSRSVSPVDVGKSDVVSGAGVEEEAAEIGNVNKNSKPDLSSSKSNSPNNPYKSSSRLLPLRCHVSSDTGGVSAICLISELNTYQNRWTIKARVTTKSDIRSWVNAKGEGSLFSVELIDSSAIDIKATFFKEAVDKFYEMLEVDKVYTFSGGRLKDAKMEYNVCKCPYEISFDQKAEIHLADDTGDIQSHMFNFTKISDLEGVEEGKLVDILVVVKSVGDPASVVLKKIGKERLKCDLTVVDDSGVEINLTVWGIVRERLPLNMATISRWWRFAMFVLATMEESLCRPQAEEWPWLLLQWRRLESCKRGGKKAGRQRLDHYRSLVLWVRSLTVFRLAKISSVSRLIRWVWVTSQIGCYLKEH